MTARRILLTIVGLLSIVILIGSLSAGVMAFLLITNRPVDQKLLVVGPGQRLAIVDRQGNAQLLADDLSAELFRYPALAPDGSRVAYISRRGNVSILQVIDLRSGTRTELYRSTTNPPLYMVWSPDGQYLSFLSNRGTGGLGMHIVPTDGSHEAELVSVSPSSLYLAWQPDSSSVLVHIGGSIFEDGRVITVQPGREQPLYEIDDPGFFQVPAWSVDGESFFYVAQPPIEGPPTVEKVESVLTRVKVGEMQPQVLAREPMAAIIFSRSPKSDEIAYTTVGPEGFGPLKLVTLDGSVRTLSSADDNVVAFFWSPNGEQIAYLTPAGRSSNGSPQLRWQLAGRNGASSRTLNTFVPSQEFLAQINFFDAYALSFNLWSSDGRALTYGTNDGVHVLDINRGIATRRSDGVLAMWLPPDS
jgi:TolB protein